MIIKVIPTKIEADVKNPESPLKVEYVVELTTEVYSDIMSSGITYLGDKNIQNKIGELAEIIKQKIESDLGISNNKTIPNETQEEEL